MVTQLFELWRLSVGEQAALLGLSADNRSTLARYRKGDPLADSRDLLDRAGHLLGIHKSLRILFPHDRELAYRYGEPTLRAMHRASGLHITDALRRLIGDRPALVVGIGTAFLRWQLTPRSRRTLHPVSAVRQLVQVLTSLLGAMSLGGAKAAIGEASRYA